LGIALDGENHPDKQPGEGDDRERKDADLVEGGEEDVPSLPPDEDPADGPQREQRDIADADDPVAKRAELIESYEETYLNPWEATDRGYVDDVIDPAETRVKLVAALEILRTKREELPNRKHGNIPL
jgi:hypothetical protein